MKVELTGNYLINALSISVVFMSLWFLYALVKKRIDVIDISWGLGFIAVAFGTLLLQDQETVAFAKSLVLALVSVWGLRLAVHIYMRNRNKTEDKRYEAMKKRWKGSVMAQAFVRVYMLQAVLLTIVGVADCGGYS